MGIKLYDDALVAKINYWIPSPGIQVLSPEEVTRMLEIKADQKKDAPLALPFVALSRDRDIRILNRQKQLKTFSGVRIGTTEDEKVLQLNAIPIEINYQLDIYTKTMQQADEFVRNFVFNFINNPNLKVTIPYNDVNYEHYSTIWLEDTITDNSDIKERLFPGQFIRFSLKLVVDDAYLFSVPIKEASEVVEIDNQIKEGEEITQYDIVYEKTD